MDTNTSECYVFYTPRPDIEGSQRVETFVGKAARDFRGFPTAPLREHGSPIVVPSLSDMPQEIGGSFATATYQVQDGVILKLYAKKRMGWNAVMKHCVMFLKAREHAAHRVIRFRPNPSNRLALDWLGVQGRFDILTMKEAEAFGARVIEATRRLSDGSDSSLVTDEIIEAETFAPIGFKEASNGVLIPHVKRRRKIEDI
jgi:hypothetical protein